MHNPILTAREVAETILVDAQARARLVAYAGFRFRIAPNEAEELLQDTAIELLRQRSYVRNPEAFVFTVFRARCARYINSHRSRRNVFASHAARLERGVAPMGSESFDLQLALQQALGNVSAPCQRLLRAYYVEGLSLRETAEGMALAYSSVPKTLSRCLKNLRKCFFGRATLAVDATVEQREGFSPLVPSSDENGPLQRRVQEHLERTSG